MPRKQPLTSECTDESWLGGSTFFSLASRETKRTTTGSWAKNTWDRFSEVATGCVFKHRPRTLWFSCWCPLTERQPQVSTMLRGSGTLGAFSNGNAAKEARRPRAAKLRELLFLRGALSVDLPQRVSKALPPGFSCPPPQKRPSRKARGKNKKQKTDVALVG